MTLDEDINIILSSITFIKRSCIDINKLEEEIKLNVKHSNTPYVCLISDILEYFGDFQFKVVYPLLTKPDKFNFVISNYTITNTTLFNKLSKYIYYKVLNDIKRGELKNMIYEMYETYDLSGLKALYRLFLNYYLNLDYVSNFNFHKGFYQLYTKIDRLNFNTKYLIDYQVLQIVSNYVSIPSEFTVSISTRYKCFIRNLISKLLPFITEDMDKHNIQHQRCIEFLNLLSTGDAPNTLLHTNNHVIRIFKNIRCNYKMWSCKYNPLYKFPIINFFLKHMSRLRYIQHQLVLYSYDKPFITSLYFLTLDVFCRQLTKSNYNLILTMIEKTEDCVVNNFDSNTLMYTLYNIYNIRYV